MRLNPAQHAAVQHSQGPLLVLAGAGSGKTRVITSRIARLVGEGVDRKSILAVSFTNKSANELRERMSHLVGKTVADELWLSTFHSFGVRFLRMEGKRLGFDGKFVILDQSDSLGLVRELLREHDHPAGCLVVNAMGSGNPPDAMRQYLTNLRTGFAAALLQSVPHGGRQFGASAHKSGVLHRRRITAQR